MSSIESIDFDNNEINLFYKSLDEETKKKLSKYSKEIQTSILKSMKDSELTNLFNSLSQKEQTQLESIGIRDKYLILKKMLKDKEKKKILEEKKNPVESKKTSFNIPAQPETTVNNENNLDEPTMIYNREVPKEFLQDEQEIISEKKNTKYEEPPLRLNKLVEKYYSMNPFLTSTNDVQHELEVKFGTKGILKLTRDDYDNVIKKMKSLGFDTNDSVGLFSLRTNCEYLDNITGKFKLSPIRVEINGLHNIEEYCRTDNLKTVYTSSPLSINFVNKKVAILDKVKMYPVDFDDFNFRVTYNLEEGITKKVIKDYMFENWRKLKKTFRYLNRVTFKHPDYPFNIDISITKYGNRGPDRYGNENRGEILRVYTVSESNVFNNKEEYDIEIEINNKEIGPGTKFNNSNSILESLRKVIKYVLSGLQGTNYPISYPEQKSILQSYMKLIWKNEYDDKKRIQTKNFIGPNSITLQIVNIGPLDNMFSEANIRKDFVVTDKADGQRHLLYISDKGKIYLINSNMDVIFTGAKTTSDECFDTLLDGELILHDKNGKYINLFAAFDIYYHKKMDVREYTFMLLKDEKDIHKSRYYLLKHIMSLINPVSIMNVSSNTGSLTKLLSNYKNFNDLLSPIRISAKEFFPMSPNESIFQGCETILLKEKDNRFEYTTDGLIFTHAYYGVGSQEIGKAGPKTKITWEQSFKWKPPQYNTIDFLVKTLKEKSEDIVRPLYEDGINASSVIQLNDYKIIELNCGFNENKNGYINPCQDIIDDKLPHFVPRYEEKYDDSYIPFRFYPTEPYDPNAGLCNIMLRYDDAGVKQMFTEENEVFTDDMIVEFRYDFSREDGWRWVPLRVRYDKTTKYKRNEKEYGNAYKTCNENWKSIHPAGRITEDMLATGLNIPDLIVSEDKYYNTPVGKLKTEAMKNFHNLYVKKLLIKNVSKHGDTLIDFACGKAGDLPKWIASQLSFVFGIDLSKDNLENRIDGACARYLNLKKTNKIMPYALFVNGNSGYNIRNGSALLNDKAKQITSAVFGNGPKDPEKIGKGVAKQYGVGEDGFNISSCQFAIHYFLENADLLQGFMKNIAQCTKLNGYFIGTCYDGKLIFNLLKKTQTGDSIQIIDDGKKIWEITKRYGSDIFEDDSSSIGYKIDVYQESINNNISEYLVNFNYLDRVMKAYGFDIISHEEAKSIGLPEGSGLFSELFTNMLEEIKINKYKAKDYGNAMNMSSFEKKISFLNRYFVYKKIMEVNVDKVQLELSEYQESEIQRNNKETTNAIEVAKKENKLIKPKVRKLSKKIILVPGTEALDEKIEIETKQVKPTKTKKETKIKKETKKETKAKKIVIESDSDDEDK
jgi:hypothetical protein